MDGLTITIHPVQLDVTLEVPFIGISTSGPRGPAGSSVITSVTNGNGLTLSGGVLSLSKASATTAGGLSSADWTTFSNKLDSSALDGYATESWVETQLSSYLTITEAAETYQPKGAYITSIGTTTPTSITGLLKGASGTVAQAQAGTDYVAPGGVGTVTTIADVTITASDLPTYPASANATTDIVTLTGRNPVNGETYYIEGGTPPTISGGSYTFSNEWTGPVVYVINASGNTCQISANKGGAALDITNAGSGWTMRRAGLPSVTISGLSESTAGKQYEILAIEKNGHGWTVGLATSLRAYFNGDQSASNYKNGTGEAGTIFQSSAVGNLQSLSCIRLTHCGTYLAGDSWQTGLSGTSPAAADSIPRSLAPQTCSYNPNADVTLSSVTFIDPNPSDFIKLGSRFIIKRVN